MLKLVSALVIGIAGGVAFGAIALPDQAPSTATARAVTAANAFLASLDASQRPRRPTNTSTQSNRNGTTCRRECRTAGEFVLGTSLRRSALRPRQL